MVFLHQDMVIYSLHEQIIENDLTVETACLNLVKYGHSFCLTIYGHQTLHG